jgi:hypothetical protein
MCVYVKLMHEKKEWRATLIIRIETKILSVGYENLMKVLCSDNHLLKSFIIRIKYDNDYIFKKASKCIIFIYH